MKLPKELLEKVFISGAVTKKDLLQLLLTCKSWSAIAEKVLYKAIDLGDEELYSVDPSVPLAAANRAKLLIRTLTLPNNYSRFWIQTINLGWMLSFYDFDYSSQDPHISIALLAHLCPNICNITTESMTPDFYKFLTQSHRDGYLQHLQYICCPGYDLLLYNKHLWDSYNAMLQEFKNCIRNVLVIDPSDNGFPTTISHPMERLITTPDDLRMFPNIESLRVLEYSRMKLHQLDKYIQQSLSQLKLIEIQMNDKFGIQDQGSVVISVVQPQHRINQLDIMFNEPISQDDIVCMMQNYSSLEDLCFAVNGPMYDSPNLIDKTTIYQFLEYLFKIPVVDFGEIHLDIDGISELVQFIARSIQVKTVRLSALDPFNGDQALISLQHKLMCRKAASDRNEQIKTTACKFEVVLILDETSMLFSRILSAFKSEGVEKLILGPQYIQDNSLPLQITQDLIDIILDNYQLLNSLIFTLVEFPENDSSAPTAPGEKKHLDLLSFQECVITPTYLSELSRRFEYVNELRYLDSEVNQYYLNSENAKISIHMPYTTFNIIDFKFPAIRPYLIKITTATTSIGIKTSREQGLARLSMEDFIQFENANDTYQVDMICNAVSTVSTIYGSFEV
ncbi:unnamed protein product [Mucor circinelloides]